MTYVDSAGVGRILICEPDPEVRELLCYVVTRLGHEPVVDAHLVDDLEAIVLEPADAPSVERAQAFRAVRADLPIVCASIEPPTAGSRRLAPVAHLVKPFALLELEAALARALRPEVGADPVAANAPAFPAI